MNIFRHNPGILLAIGSFILYLVTLSPYPYPGHSAQLIALHAGLNEFSPSTHFLWNRLVFLCTLVPFGSLALKLNLVSACFGSLTVWITYHLGAQVRFKGVEKSYIDQRLAIVCGTTAALFLALAPAFWYSATRAHVASFDLALFAATLYSLVRFRHSSRPGWLHLFCFLYGLGMVEYPVFVLLLPFTAVYLGYLVLYRKRKIRTRYFLGSFLSGLAGLSIYLPAAFLYRETQSAEWLGLEAMVDIHKHLWGHHIFQLMHHVPRIGWIVYFAIGFIPVLFALANAADREAFLDRLSASSFLYVTSLLLGITVYLAPQLRELRLITANFIVLPYFLLALTLGHAAGFFYLLAFREQARTPTERRRKIRQQSAYPKLRLTVLAAAVALLTCAAMNARYLSTRNARIPFDWAKATLDSMGDRTWLISRGRLGDLLLIAAHERNRPITYINTKAAGSLSYRRYMASRVQESRLKAMAEIGLKPLLKDWLHRDPTAGDLIAFFDYPTIWESTPFEVIPKNTLYLGHAENTVHPEPDWFEQSMAYWESVREEVVALRKSRHELSFFGEYQAGHLSRVANNAGVLLENQGQIEDAARAYDIARTLHDGNAYALLNLYQVRLRHRMLATDQEALYDRLQDLFSQPINQSNREMLTRIYGPLKDRGALKYLSHVFYRPVVSAREEVGLREVINSLIEGNQEQAQEWLDYILEENPTYEAGWIVRAVLARESGDKVAFKRCVEQMNRLEQIWGPILYFQSLDAKKLGDYETAGSYLKKIVERFPNDLPALMELLVMAIDANDLLTVRGYARRILTLDPDNPIANFAMGYDRIMDEKYSEAEAFLRKAVQHEVKPPFALNNLAWTLLAQKNYDEALYFAQQALEDEARFWQVWHTIAMAHLKKGQLEEAGRSLVEALELEPRNPDILSALAEWLRLMGHEQESTNLKEKLSDPDNIQLTVEQVEALKAFAVTPSSKTKE